MDFQAVFDNYVRVLRDHYFDMHGRVGRPEFWYFVLANIVAAILAHIIGRIIHLPIGELYSLAVLLPATCLSARRLQDVGKDGKLAWILFFLAALNQILGVIAALSFFVVGFFALALVPFLSVIGILTLIAAIVMLYFCCQPGDAGENAYGPPPPVFNPNPAKPI